jgi:SAM-dependent methyltransferase
MSEGAPHVPVAESGPSPAPDWVRRPRRGAGDSPIFLREFLDDLPAGAVVLDLGSGPGSFDYRRRRDWTLLATDILPLRPSEPPVPWARWFRADASRLPLADACADAVVAHYLLEHVTDLGGTMDEIARVLRPGGCVFASAPRAASFDDRFYRFAGYVAKYGLGKFRKRIEHQQKLSFQSLVGAFYRRGFVLEGFAVVPAGFSWMNDPRTQRLQGPFVGALGWVRRLTGLDLFREANFLCVFRHVGRRGQRTVTNVCRRCGEHALVEPPDPPPARWTCPWCGFANGLFLTPAERRRLRRRKP